MSGFIECVVLYVDNPRQFDFKDGVDHGPTAKVIAGRNFWEATKRPVSQEEAIEKCPVEGSGGFYHTFLIMN